MTIGSPLTGPFTQATAGGVFTNANASLTEPGATATSPITGVIVRWRIDDASGGPFSLRVLTAAGGGQYTGVGTSGPETPANAGIQTFTTHLPIAAGQTIGFDNGSSAAKIGIAPTGGSIGWNPPLADGSTRPPNESGSGEFAFTADVEPPPGISSLQPSSGPVVGGTSVVITGHDFTDATAVSVGGAPATRFTVDSDSQITATAPAHAKPTTVDVSVTTPAGETPPTAADRFRYKQVCVVPKLKGKPFGRARSLLASAHCKLGKVKRPKQRGGKLIVKAQSASSGTVLAKGARVSLKLVLKQRRKPAHTLKPHTQSNGHSYQHGAATLGGL